MNLKNCTISFRKPRADAQRNREHLIEVARQTFTESASDPTSVTMDEIARRAKVGPGTLYRHFPTRDALLEAVYRTGVQEIVDAQQRFSATLPPVEALRAWLLLFVDYLAAKQIIAPALNAMTAGPSRVYASSSALLKTAIETLVQHAVASGDFRPGLEPLDILRAIAGLSNQSPTLSWSAGAKKLVNILIAGSRQ